MIPSDQQSNGESQKNQTRLSINIQLANQQLVNNQSLLVNQLIIVSQSIFNLNPVLTINWYLHYHSSAFFMALSNQQSNGIRLETKSSRIL